MLEYLQLPESLEDLELVCKIWESFHFMFTLLKSEPSMQDDRTAVYPHTEGFTWHYTKEQCESYKWHAERFYQLLKIRYSHDHLTPYMMKFIDYAPHFMKTCPPCPWTGSRQRDLSTWTMILIASILVTQPVMVDVTKWSLWKPCFITHGAKYAMTSQNLMMIRPVPSHSFVMSTGLLSPSPASSVAGWSVRKWPGKVLSATLQTRLRGSTIILSSVLV